VAVAPASKQPAAVALPTTHARWPAAWIAGTLALIVVAGIVALVFHGRTPLQPATSAAVVEKPAPAPPPPAPTSSPPAIPAPATFSLTGIMKDPGGQYCAVLNGRVVYEGHVVEGATVKSIDRDRVTMEQNDRETVLRLF
jgi:CubicO group peptidase (beta-lactamase class C family)